MNKVFIVNASQQYCDMFKERGWEVVCDLDKADLIQFTGGEDVTPSLYLQEPHKATHSSSERDLYEIGIYLYGLRNNVPMAGICRGGQFLNVMNGGTMIQHVGGHATANGHYVDVQGYDKLIKVSSTHHQMMLSGEEGYVIGVADSSDFETEIVAYQNTRCLCFQPHPEFEGFGECRELYFRLLGEMCS